GHILDAHLDGKEFHQPAPAAADVEHALFRRHSDLLMKPPELVELRLIQIIRPLEEGAGVDHPPVQPEAEKLVRDIICDGDIRLCRQRSTLLSPFPSMEDPSTSDKPGCRRNRDPT